MKKLIRCLPSAVGALLFCLWIPATAQNQLAVCQAEISRAKTAYASSQLPTQIEAEVRNLWQKTDVEWRCKNADAVRNSITMQEQTRANRFSPSPETHMGVFREIMFHCIMRAQLNQCSGISTPATVPTSNQSSQSNNTSSSDASDSNASQNTNAINLANKRQPELDKARQEELKRQKDKTAQYDASWALERTKMAQETVDAIRKDKRTRHRPEGEAHQCLQLKKAGLYGGFNNTCSDPVTYFFCHYQPRKDSWGESLDCEKGKIGMGSVQPNTGAAEHTYNSAMIYWFACKKDFNPADAEFVLGQGLRGRCIQ